MSLIKSATPRNCNRKTLNEEEESGLIQCAHLILPWLTPSELANTSLTCKTLFHFSKTVVGSRCLDASRSFENLPVPFHNTLDKTPYAYFLYTPSQIISSSPSHSPQRQFWGSTFHTKLKPGSLSQRGPISVVADSADFSVGLSRRCEKPGGDCVDAAAELGESDCGCECEKCLEVGDENGVFGCPCSYGVEEVGIASECGPSCRCGLECENRVSQRGIRVRLKIVRVSKKGWGLFADQFIPRGQFICEYAGELLTTKEARRRQKIYDEHASRYGISSALLVVREHLPSGKACLRMNIDATRVGNVARFINHSCDGGNLSTVLVRRSGALLPRLCFFASKVIQEGEELTFSYGEIRLRSEGLPCFCGSSCCFGILPSENT
ncbi:histone-lysine N-methyltransferase SUVR3 [Mangifera indica]|uniref:histone-lysine N-methyltransferase SUVR3 n=1 Tax=Mangifera indica TaxID=29780 RepID=UPI001CFB430E|nr:histone-lysine N-methyltransferase SUVR3 [Mangifera indica]